MVWSPSCVISDEFERYFETAAQSTGSPMISEVSRNSSSSGSSSSSSSSDVPSRRPERNAVARKRTRVGIIFLPMAIAFFWPCVVALQPASYASLSPEITSTYPYLLSYEQRRDPTFDRFSVLAEIPHDPNAFTQGLCFANGFLYESTGLPGRSSVRKLDPTTGEVIDITLLGGDFFGEGLTCVDDQIYSLTWKSEVGFAWDPHTLEMISQFRFHTPSQQGWGMTAANQTLIVSEGTDLLLFLDVHTKKETKRVKVCWEGKALDEINDLQEANGYVFANVFKEDKLYKIDPETGTVVGVYDFSSLYPKIKRDKEFACHPMKDASWHGVMNGIAADPEDSVLYLTGKLWPVIYKVRLDPHHNEETSALFGNDIYSIAAAADDGANQTGGYNCDFYWDVENGFFRNDMLLITPPCMNRNAEERGG